MNTHCHVDPIVDHLVSIQAFDLFSVMLFSYRYISRLCISGSKSSVSVINKQEWGM